MVIFKLVREVLCIAGLAFLIKFTYDYHQTKNIKQGTQEQAMILAKKTANGMMEKVSDGLISLGKVTKKARFRNASSQTEEVSTEQAIKEELDILGQQIKLAYSYLQKDDIIDTHVKNQLLGSIKATASQREHLEKQINKGAPIDSALTGPARSSAEEVYKRTVERKFLALVNKVEGILADLSHEITGDVTIEQARQSTTEGVAHNDALLKTLVS